MSKNINKDVPFTIYRTDSKGRKTKKVIVPEKKYNSLNKAPNWKNLFLTTAIIAGSVAGMYFLSKDTKEKKNTQIDVSESSKESNYIASAKYKGKTYFFTPKDSLITALSKQTTYFDFENLSLNKDSLKITYDLAKQLSLPEIIETANLNGMHKLYTGYSKGETNFESALNKLWLAKVTKMKGRFSDLGIEFTTEYNPKHAKKTTLEKYKSKIDKELEILLDNFDYEEFYKKHNNPNEEDPSKSAGHPEKQRFLENYLSHLNSNMLASYGITELFPAETNPTLNVVFLDKMLQNAGEEFLNKIPALFDPYLSFGFFQLTSKIITPEGAPSLNTYLPNNLKIPASMKYYNTSEEHIRGAILVNIYNAEILANTLFKANEITNFNNNFEKLSSEAQEAFISGYASAAHHAPTQAANAVLKYQKNVNSGKKEFKKITSDLELSGNVKGYYAQSMKNYLVLKYISKNL